ncbi:MAG: enoyl-CoA hydratase-related protein [Acidimicrobiia bacterium]
MGEGPLRVETDGRGVTTVTLDRPEVRNAFDAALITGLRETFQGFAVGDGTRVVVLTGEGTAFCAGADLNWMSGMVDKGFDEVDKGFDENVADSRVFEEMLRAVHDCPHPLVARVNGHAFGGGVGLVAAADVAIGAEEALFSFSEVRLGLAPAVISPYVLEKIGLAAARNLMLTGERFNASAAAALGLLTRAVPGEELDAAVEMVVTDLLLGAPEAQAAVKRLLREVAGRSPAEAAPVTTEMIARLRVSDEGQEGMRAFFEKRAPSWHVEG